MMLNKKLKKNKEITLNKEESLAVKPNPFKSRKSFWLILTASIVVLFLVIIIYNAMKFYRPQKIADFSGCKYGETVKFKNLFLTSVGIEEYKSSQLEGKVCHLSYSKDNFTADFYLDEKALQKFNGSSNNDIGNGCLVFNLGSLTAKTESCFGEMIKAGTEEEMVKSDSKFIQALEKIASGSFEKTGIPSSQNSPEINFSGTKWRYIIQAGGGVEGIMTFEKDDYGSIKGSFTENGPEGQRTKKFSGSKEKDLFLLTLEEFPTFKIELSKDGKTMTGKPRDEVKDIFYPDDFFKATIEK